MSDARRTAADTLAAAVRAGDQAASRAAAIELLDVTRAAGASWAIEKQRRFAVLPLTTDDWGAIMLADRGAAEGPRLWGRHRASEEPLAALGLADFSELLLCRLVAGDATGLPRTPAPVGMERELVAEADLLRRLLEAVAAKDAGSLGQALKALDRLNWGVVFGAGVRALARSRGVKLSA
jgi:hypothetical protein